MDHKTADAYVKHFRGELGRKVKVGIPLRTGTHHTIALFGRTSGGEYTESWRKGHRTSYKDLGIETHVGDIIYQRTTSTMYGSPIERYGVVVGENNIDWGVDADWIVDFGSAGEATTRGHLHSPAGRFLALPGRLVPHSPEPVTASAVPGAGGGSGGSG